MPHISVSGLITIGSGNGLSPVRCQAITGTNAEILSIGPSRTNFSEIWMKIQNFSFKKVHLKMSSVIWWPFFRGRWVNGSWLCGAIHIWMFSLRAKVTTRALDNDFKMVPGPDLTNHKLFFLIPMQIDIVVIWWQAISSLSICTHAMTAQLLFHIQNFCFDHIIKIGTRVTWISIVFVLHVQNCWEMGHKAPWPYY